MNNKGLLSKVFQIKRIIFKFLFFILLQIIIGPTIVTQAAVTFTGIKYQIINNSATVTGYTGSNLNIIIPDTFNGYPVTAIGNNAFRNSKLKSITLPNSLVTIGRSSFQDCASLTNIILPESVKTIETESFYYCTSLSTITLPENLTSIGDNAFNSCSSLRNLHIPSNLSFIGCYAFENTPWLNELPKGFQIVGDNILIDYTGSDTSITIPQGVKTIAPKTFYESNAQNIVIPNSVTIIGDYSFAGCSFHSITLPDSLSIIGKGAFSKCLSLVSLNLPDSIVDIKDSAFQGCENLQAITLPSNLKKVSKNLFNGCNSLTYVSIPNGMVDIGNSAFYNCTKLLNINIPNSLKYIDEYAFYACKNLKTVVLPEGLIKIGKYAYQNCTALDSITIPDTVSDIGIYAFTNTGIKRASIPNDWTSLPEGIFANCKNLSDIELPKILTSIGNYAFSHTGLLSLQFPDSVISIGDYAFQLCDKLSSVIIPNTVKSIGTGAFEYTPWFKNFSDSFLVVGDGILIQFHLTGKPDDKLIIPDGVKIINGDAFKCLYSNSGASYTSLTIPEGVTHIGNGAFYNFSHIKVLRLPSTLVIIDKWAFAKCKSLESISFSSGLKTIDAYAFRDCISLKHVFIPDTVQFIGARAFANCGSLSQITIPNPVINIDDLAFAESNALLTIYGIEGSSAQKLALPLSNIKFIATALPTPLPATYFVTFDSGYGSYVPSIAVLSDTTIATPSDSPICAGNAFLGWYTKEDGGMKITFPYTVKGDVTLYAHWSPIQNLTLSNIKAISINFNTCQISWNKLIGPTEYLVYRSTSYSGAYSLVATINALTYQDTDLSMGTTYYYKVLPCQNIWIPTSDGIYTLTANVQTFSQYSTIVSAKPVLSAPTSLKVTKTKITSAKITWSSSQGASGYTVYRATSKNGTYTAIADVKTANLTNTNLKSNIIYYYKIAAYRIVNGKKIYSRYTSIVSIKM